MLLTVAHPFDRALAVGDTGQIEAVHTMNGLELYCPWCFCVQSARRSSGHLEHTQGDVCPECGRGRLEWGAASRNGGLSVFDAASLKGRQ